MLLLRRNPHHRRQPLPHAFDRGRQPGDVVVELLRRPASLAGQGSAQVWTVDGKPYRLAVVSADSAATISALQRGLPHYGGQSWLIFDQARAIKKGVWPATVPEIPVLPAHPGKDEN